jgi:predicted outer membrane repeat protein
MLFDSTTNVLLSAITVVHNTAGLMGGGVYLRKRSTYVGFAGVRFEGNTCTRGSGGALYIGASCSFIAIGGLQPLLQTLDGPDCMGIGPSCLTSRTIADKTLTGGAGFTALGFFVTFLTQPLNVITHGTDHAYVGNYKYGLKSAGNQGAYLQEPLDPITLVNSE